MKKIEIKNIKNFEVRNLYKKKKITIKKKKMQILDNIIIFKLKKKN